MEQEYYGQSVANAADDKMELNRLKNTVARLEELVGALCSTSFLTQHEDGDEEAREAAVEKVNYYSRQYADKFKADKEIEALEQQKRELDNKIESLKYGTLKYGKVSGRYATSLGQSMINTTNLVNQALATSTISIPATQVVAPADKLEAAAQIVKLATGSK